jgi:hypothetical protein
MTENKMTEQEFCNIKTLHELFRVALDEIKQIPEGVEIDMHTWCDVAENGTCYVCLAGSVMLKLRGVVVEMYPEDFVPEVRKRLHAIDDLRLGAVNSAYSRLYGEQPKEWITIPLFNDYEALYNWLKEKGL